jgi:MSHA biogenesis protein MshO
MRNQPAATGPQKGMSMIELIVVITVLGIIAAGTAIYLVRSMQSYTDSVRRDELTAVARAATERVVRELRNAAPNSIRVDSVTAAGVTTHCIEFMPVLRASAYLDLPLTAPNVSFPAVPYTAPTTTDPLHVVVYPYSGTALYTTGSPGQVADYDEAASDPAAGDVHLDPAHQYTYRSPRKRFFIVSDPVSFCIDDGTNQLRRYSAYGIQSSQTVPPAVTPALLANDIFLNDGGSTVTPFAYDAGDLSRAGVVSLDFRFMQDGEWVRLRQEVQIRNAP